MTVIALDQPDERPLTARSVLLSTLLGTEQSWLPTRRLVRAAALFGIADGASRTALSRMTSRGEVVAHGEGYALTGSLLARQARQSAGRHPTTRDWDGSWVIGLVTGEGRTAQERSELRHAMRGLGIAERREGVWCRPDNLVHGSFSLDERCTWWRGRPDDEPRSVAADLWDLGGWARRSLALRAEMADLGIALRADDPGALAPGFVVSAAVLRHLQRDPLLPRSLLPRSWPGAALRRDYDRFDRAYRRVLATWWSIDD